MRLEAANQTIQNQHFMLVLQKFNSSANGDNDDSLSYIYSGDFVNNVTFNVTTLKKDLMNLTTARVDKFCL